MVSVIKVYVCILLYLNNCLGVSMVFPAREYIPTLQSLSHI